MRLALVLSILILGSGCVTAAQQQEAARVRVLMPTPMVDLNPSRDTMALRFEPAVLDNFMLPEKNGVTAVPVESWHASLRNGFARGPGRFFVPGGADSTYSVVLVEARLDYIPNAMFARGNQVVGAASVVARIQFMARLVDREGNVLRRSQGIVGSTQSWTEMGGSSTTAMEAIEAMYVQISHELLTNLPVQGEAGGSPTAVGTP